MGNVTNLDFVELLLQEGADQDHLGMIPLVRTTPDANITTRFGESPS
jgi:hypothetical protein